MKFKLNPFRDKKQIEFARKFIHISSILLPIYYRYVFNFNRRETILVLLLMLVISIVVEFLRLENRNFRKYFNFAFGIMLRKHERRDFTGASYLLTSAIVCVAIFPPMIAFLAMCFLSIGDTFAAIIGMNFGKRKIRNTSKSFEGALACFITTLSFGILINYNIPIDHIWYLNPIVVTCGAVAATIAETSNIDIDDNVKIPIISGIVMSITYIFV